MNKMLQRVVFFAATVAATSAMASVTFYEGPEFQGQPLSVDGALPDFRAYDFNDRAMSLVVEGAPVEVCWDIHFGGNCQVFIPGAYRHLGVWSNRISSVRPAFYRGQFADRRYEQRHYDRRGHDQYDRHSGWDRNYWDHAPNDYYRRGY